MGEEKYYRLCICGTRRFTIGPPEIIRVKDTMDHNVEVHRELTRLSLTMGES